MVAVFLGIFEAIPEFLVDHLFGEIKIFFEFADEDRA